MAYLSLCCDANGNVYNDVVCSVCFNKEVKTSLTEKYKLAENLQLACQDNDVSTVKNLLSTTVHLCCFHSVYVIVQAAIEEVCHLGNVKMLEVLLQYSVIDNDIFNSAMHVACANNQLDAVKLLMRHGFDPDMCMVCDRGHGDIVDALILSGGIDGLMPLRLRDESCRPQSLLHMVQRAETARILIHHGADPNMVEANNRHFSPLHKACLNRSVDIVGVLLESGAIVNAVASAKETPLHVLLRDSYRNSENTSLLPIAKLLLDAGADVRAFDESDETALHIACKRGLPDLVDCLLRCGADMDARSATLDTPLHNACCVPAISLRPPHDGRHTAIVRTLVKHGAAPRAANCDGATPLYLAAKWLYGDGGVARALLDGGADVDVRERRRGETPLMLLCRRLEESRCGLLPFRSAARERHVRAARIGLVWMLLHEGAHVDAADAGGRTPRDALASARRRVMLDPDDCHLLDDLSNAMEKRYHLSLQCQAARAFVQHGLPTEMLNRLPAVLAELVRLHVTAPEAESREGADSGCCNSDDWGDIKSTDDENSDSGDEDSDWENELGAPNE
ncbi:PREDICTED: ankyrin-1-like [Priapulus caudatus]|uniref:Ankyrin-1-like n=1 Tax=Priapulus caudatus TaxID=37621 RepID=A0ABM1EDD9_PRICU|nr:PREDICTED: ankyrin-1-like [Priapulus caudatus]